MAAYITPAPRSPWHWPSFLPAAGSSKFGALLSAPGRSGWRRATIVNLIQRDADDWVTVVQLFRTRRIVREERGVDWFIPAHPEPRREPFTAFARLLSARRSL